MDKSLRHGGIQYKNNCAFNGMMSSQPQTNSFPPISHINICLYVYICIDSSKLEAIRRRRRAEFKLAEDKTLDATAKRVGEIVMRGG